MLYIGPQLDLAIFNYRLLRRNIEQQKGITTLSAAVIPSLPTQSKNLKKIWLLIYMSEIFLPNWSQNISWFSSGNSYWTFSFMEFFHFIWIVWRICKFVQKMSNSPMRKYTRGFLVLQLQLFFFAKKGTWQENPLKYFQIFCIS